MDAVFVVLVAVVRGVEAVFVFLFVDVRELDVVFVVFVVVITFVEAVFVF